MNNIWFTNKVLEDNLLKHHSNVNNNNNPIMISLNEAVYFDL